MVRGRPRGMDCRAVAQTAGSITRETGRNACADGSATPKEENFGAIEWRRGAPWVGRSASVVSALSSCVAKSRQTLHTFPPPPLKFRTAGFPQYGFKPDYSATIFLSPTTA